MSNDGSPYAYRRMCDRCHLRLNRKVAPDGSTTYHHGFTADHDPVPVMEPPEQDVILVCDFCLTPHPTWDFSCEDFTDQQSVTSDTRIDIGTSLGDWASCNPCKELIVAGRWDDLADRSIQGQITHNPDAAAAYAASPAIMFVNRMGMMNLHRQFDKARKGPPTPIIQATWIASKLREIVGEQE